MKDSPARHEDSSQNGSAGASRLRAGFRRFGHATATAVGSPWAFALALAVLLVWALSGPLFHFSDTWQLIINTATTVVTFLMVFLIQNTQNRDAKAIHLKLDELIRGIKGARTRLVDLEDLSDEELDRLQREFQRLRKRAGDERAARAEQPGSTEEGDAKAQDTPPQRRPRERR